MIEMAVKTKRPLLQEVINTCSQLNIPAQAVLELTYRCNLHCVHCYVDLNETDELTTVEWKNVIDELKAASTMYLLFTGGEIMLRPDLLDIATYAHHNGFMLGFLTNGTMLTPATCRAIAEFKPFSMGISLYGATAATHELVTGIPGSFQKTIAGIKMLVDAGLVPTVQTLIMKYNLNELASMKMLVESLGATFRINMGMGPTKTGRNSPFQYEPDEVATEDYGWWLKSPHLQDCGGPCLCKAGKALCSISPHGDVFPCIMFPLKLGNLRKSSFESIWHGEPRIELQNLRSMTHSDLSSCNACELKTYCQRCTGIAYLESGNVGGVSPSACRQAKTRQQLSRAMGGAKCPKNLI
jgi:radical SAM protein with 4Fe4S-binding SPASM domain